MISPRLLPLTFLLLILFNHCSPVRTKKDPAGETPSPMGTEMTPDMGAQPPAPGGNAAEGLPVPALPDGTAPLDFAKIPEVPLLAVPVADVKAAVPLLGAETWYGVYVMNQKVGYMSNAWSVKDTPEGPRVLQVQQFHMEMNVLGGKKTMVIRTTSTYDGAGEGALLEHVTLQTADHVKRTVTLRRQPDGSHQATVESVAAGQTPAPLQTYTSDRPLGGLSESDLAFSLTISRDPKTWNATRSWRARKFMSTEVTVAHEVGRVVSRTERRVDGKTRPFTVVETISDNPKSRVVSVFNELGFIEVSKIGTIEMRHEDKDKAAAGMGTEIDTGLSAVIPLPLAGTPAASITKLVLDLNGPFPNPEFLNTHRYQLDTTKGKKLTLSVDTIDNLQKPDPATLPADVKKYLKSEPNVESDDPGVIKLARLAAGGAKTPVEILRAVTLFVGDYVEDTLRSDVESARMVAQLKKGDCTEHSILATALFRALGFPARQVGGVGYVRMCGTDSCLEGLGYHAWTQVWVGRWIDVDPTWKQMPADVTHLMMGATDDMEWLESLGNLKITVLEKEVSK
ncbi:transglutaminase-like domain-containing protein [Myxococcota bacterium]|nr:transglutaminase-like domain-containing protein [Myxococcota bacterium]